MRKYDKNFSSYIYIKDKRSWHFKVGNLILFFCCCCYSQVLCIYKKLVIIYFWISVRWKIRVLSSTRIFHIYKTREEKKKCNQKHPNEKTYKTKTKILPIKIHRTIFIYLSPHVNMNHKIFMYETMNYFSYLGHCYHQFIYKTQKQSIK